MDAATTERILEGMAWERQREAPPANFPPLPRIPAGRYLDPDFLALEREHVWKKAWVYALHVDELPEVGSFRLWDRLGSPILIVRSADDAFRAFYNTCAHRGAPLVQTESGQRSKLFTCPYHGWSYNFDGELKAVRDPRDFPDLDINCLSLHAVRCERFGNWLFINEDPDAEPLLDAIAPFPDHWSTLALDDIAHIATSSFVIDCNVKVLLDAFMESYHLASIHQKTVNRFLDYKGTFIQLFNRGHMLMITPQRDPDWQDPGAKGMPVIDSATVVQREHNPSYHFFPNLVAPVSATGTPFLTFWPVDERTMIIDSHWFALRSAVDHPLWETRIGNWERILEEDTQFAPDIQRSIESGGFDGVTLSYQERRIYYWHEELDRRIGKDRVPSELRIAPMLDEFVESS